MNCLNRLLALLRQFIKWVISKFRGSAEREKPDQKEETPPATTEEIVVRVYLYDPAAANGLYEQWEQAGDAETEKTGVSSDSLPAKIPAEGLIWSLRENSNQLIKKNRR